MIDKGIILATGACAGALLFVLGSLLVIKLARARHKRLLAIANAAAERRLSGYPGGHLNIVEADVASFPQTRDFLRRSTRNPYGPRGWWIVSSRESLQRRPVLANNSRALVSNRENHESTTGRPSWPLPRRLTRSDATPPVAIQPSPLSPITERSATIVEASPNLVQAKAQAEEKGADQVQGKFGVQAISPGESPQRVIAYAAMLKPKPLFHDKQRSVSFGTMPESSLIDGDEVIITKPGQTDSLPMRKPSLPRSTSLCSQQPGSAPNRPIPPLPFDMSTKNRSHKVTSQIEFSPKRASVTSLLSGYTSVLDEAASKVYSQADTDFTSSSLLSPPPSSTNPLELSICKSVGARRDGSNPSGVAKSFDSSLTTAGGVPMSTQMPTNVRYSLPRSKSSGLSMSLLDNYPLRNRSSAMLLEDNNSPGTYRSTLSAPGSADRKPSKRRGVSRTSPLSCSSAFDEHDGNQSKRTSTSVLQAVSGNESNSIYTRLNGRPSSVATSNPSAWDSKTSMQPVKPSVMKRGARPHKRQSCARIANPPLLPPPTSPEYPTQHPPLPGLFMDAPFLPHQTHSRPPSLLTFDPQIPPRSPSSSCPPRRETTYSPTLSIGNLYNLPSASTSQSSINSTPTRNPTIHRRSFHPPAGANPNRHKTITPTPSTIPTWPCDVPTAPTTHLFQPTLPQSKAVSSTPRLRPPLNVPNWRRARSPIRGPRALPHPPPSIPPSHRHQRSPSRAPVRVSKTHPAGPRREVRARELEKSVMALRRMNSEVLWRGGGDDEKGEGELRYLSLGLGGGDGGAENRNRNGTCECENESVRGPRDIARTLPLEIADEGGWDGVGGGEWEGEGERIWGTPRSLYDREGFLRELA